MERHFVGIVLFFTLLIAGNAQASILVTNDWASATAQARDQKGGAVVTTSSWDGGAIVNIGVQTPDWDWAAVSVNRVEKPNTLINALVVTDDSSESEVEAWLDMSWVFSVVGDAVDFDIGLLVDGGGEFTSSFALYDLTAGSYVFSDSLSGYGHIGEDGSLIAGHDYLFNASLPRFDLDDQADLVYDGSSELEFLVDTDVIFDLDRTHDRVDVADFSLLSVPASASVDVSEPTPLLALTSGLVLLGIARRMKWRQGSHSQS